MPRVIINGSTDNESNSSSILPQDPDADEDWVVVDDILGFMAACLVCSALSFVGWRCCLRRRRRLAGGGGGGGSNVTSPGRGVFRAETLYLSGLTFLWYGVSVTLGLSNKFIFNRWRGGFRFPLTVALFHLTFKGLAMFSYYGCGLCGTRCGGAIPWPSRRTCLTRMLPIGIFTGLDIGLGMVAIMMIPLSLYTVVKCSGIIFTFTLSAALRLAPRSWRLALVVACVAAGTTMSVWKNPSMDLVGLLMVLAATLSAVLRWVLTQVTTQQGEKSGVAATILFLSPSAVLTIAPFFASFEAAKLASPETGVGSKHVPGGDSVAVIWGEVSAVLVAGGFLSLILLATEVRLISLTSSLTLDVLGKLKDMMQIVMAVVTYGDTLSPTNIVGVITVLVGVTAYSFLMQRLTRGTSSSSSSLSSQTRGGGQQGGVRRGHRGSASYSPVLTNPVDGDEGDDDAWDPASTDDSMFFGIGAEVEMGTVSTEDERDGGGDNERTRLFG